MKWAYGLTTVPMRRETTLPRTLESLKQAGFDSPRLFIDGAVDGAKYAPLGLEFSTRWPVIRTFGNWFLGLSELYIREPDADRYAIFQDDFITYRNLRDYLEKCGYPDKGYLNLITHPQNQLMSGERVGWYKSNQMGRGAVALVFNNEAVRLLLSHQHMIERPKDAHRGWRSIDGGIVTAFKKAEWFEYVHNPSLISHIGTLSSMQNGPQPNAVSFKGESFDATELLPCQIHS